MNRGGVSRRSLLKGGASLLALHASRVLAPLFAATTGAKPRVAVVGAGAFGGWTALHLLRRGARVTLFDAWGPGNSRASSGGETRVIRATYGPDRVYVEMVARSLRLWREAEKSFSRPLFRKTGVLWMAGSDDRYEKAAVPLLRAAGLPVEELSAADRYVFACGPWLGTIFPDVIGDRIRPTRQEVFFFGTPAGDPAFTEDRLPVWIDNGPRVFYGIPGSEWRGFKVADDTHGPEFDPTAGERVPTSKGLRG